MKKRDQAEPLRRQARTMQQATMDKKHAKRAWKIAVTSGKGGVGKSNISLNLALALGRLEKKVLLVDADTNLANIDILLGVNVKKSLGDVIFHGAYFSDVLLEVSERVDILPGSSGMAEVLEQDSKVREGLFDAFEEFEHQYDILLVDTGAGLTETVLQFVTSADDVVLVTNSEPTSITDAYAMIKMAIMRNADIRVRTLVNLAANQREAMDTFEKLQLVAQSFLNMELSFLGYLPIDPNIPAAVAQRKPFLELYPRSSATIAMIMMARKLLKMPQTADRPGSFLQRLLRNRSDV